MLQTQLLGMVGLRALFFERKGVDDLGPSTPFRSKNKAQVEVLLLAFEIYMYGPLCYSRAYVNKYQQQIYIHLFFLKEKE